MLGFILSKINLLILVIAIFAIVSFFTLGLTDLAKINEARLLLDRVSQKSFALVSSPSYCFSDSFDLPRFIRVAGEDLYYVLKISVETIEKEEGEDVSVVIFSIHPRLEYVKYAKKERDKEPPSIAASSFRTTAQVALYSDEYLGDSYSVGAPGLVDKSSDYLGAMSGDIEGIIVDPRATDQYNTVEFLKEIRKGVPYVYIFPCNSDTCGDLKEEVSRQACEDVDLVDCDNLGPDEVWFNC
ncbi:MAG: hypothetical protein HY392_01670 [Candidatus Diapherotrites archaeon]|nr:hypothetical protein [Candidatus Diapherotrites archaeon]